jgi:cardiolipin synthase A/B
MSVIVAVPALRVSAKVWVEKGRGWSALDELILWGLDRAPTSAADLSKAIGLPRRVVLQAILRMMRFRLVDAVLLDGMPLFQTTSYGARIISGGGEIPTSRRTVSRKVSFVVDRITGTVFARRDVNSDSTRGVVLRRDQGADVREIEVAGTKLITSQTENLARFQKVLQEDETLLYFDGDTLIERADEYLITIVDGDGIRGLPPKAPTALTSAVLDVARAKDPPRPVVVQSLLAAPPDPIAPVTISIQAGNTALIMGADAHYNTFTEVLTASKRRVILHSTFLRADAFNAHLRLFKDAIRRGVRIDIFWGAGSPDEPSTKTLTEAAALSRQLSTDSLLKDHVHIHLRSTGSHCKLLIADDGTGGYPMRAARPRRSTQSTRREH